jgi:serine/threonine-protein kinase
MARLDIDAADWGRLNRLLDQALDRAPAERVAWVDSLGPEHEGLKPRLRELLGGRGAVETGDFLQTLPKIGAVHDGLPLPGAPGDVVGPYRLLRMLGSGGMGAVWLAERVDGMVTRPVALKLPHLVAMRRGELAERMAREREILATLDHRNIARLLDAGVTPEGQPFLALEHVEGIPIDRYCANEGGAPLDVAQRLRLFRQVAEAVAYAHGKLVVHRDLKPANILVSTGGGVKLLDFGIAKLLDQGLAAHTRLTEVSGRAFTPDYASPEQILGEPLTVASDVYSLGVVLFELLTGSRPYRYRTRGALEDAILGGETARASQVAPEPLRRALQGDLDTIIAMALRRDPRERYATVNALADDVTRHLEQRPVLARPDSHWYRLRKFVARNRLGVGAAALASLAVLAGSGVALWQARVAIAERDRAAAIRGFITSVFAEADPYRQFGRPLTAAEVLGRAQDDIGTRFADDAPLRLELSNLIGTSLLGLGDLEGARVAAQRTVDDASRLYGPAHEETLRARVVLAEVHAARRDNARLRPDVDELLPRARAVSGAHPDLLVRMLKVSADLAIEESRYADAAAPAEEAFRLSQARLGERHHLTVLASTLYVEALMFARAPLEVLMAEGRRGLDLALEVSGGQPDSPRVIQMRDVYVRILSRAGDLKATLSESTRLIAAAKTTFGENSLAAAHAMMNTARDYARLGEVQVALQNSAQVLEILGDRIAPDSHEFRYAASTYALMLVAARRFEEALPRIAALEDESRRVSGATHFNTVSMMFQHALALAGLRRDDEARALLDEAWAAGVADDDRAWALRMDASVRRRIGDPRRSVQNLRAAREISAEARDDARYRVALEMGLALVELGDAAAEQELRQAQEIFERLGMAMHPAQAELLIGLGRCRLQRGDAAAALPLFEHAAGFWREFDAQNPGAKEADAWVERARAQGAGSGTNTMA